MSLGFKVAQPAFEVFAKVEGEAGRALTDAMWDVAEGLKQDLRDQVVAAGLGNRLAYTWRGEAYPRRGKASWEPAALVYSKSPKLIDVYDRGATIVPRPGSEAKMLAIPTNKVPLNGKRVAISPEEVETMFNQDLIFRHGRNGHILAFVDVLIGRSGRGLRLATPGRLKQGRQRRLVLMFVMVPFVKAKRLLNVQAVADRWTNKFDAIFARRWS